MSPAVVAAAELNVMFSGRSRVKVLKLPIVSRAKPELVLVLPNH
jgi:hypothetical protein